MKKLGVVIYLSAIIGFLEYLAIKADLNGVALATAIGGLCFLGGLLFDVNIAGTIFKKIFHK